MLRVTIELVPYGVEAEAKKIATMIIANDGSGDSYWGNYVYAFKEDKSEISSGSLSNHYRNQGAWTLVKRILNSSHEIEDGKEELEERVIERLNADL